MAGSHDGMVIGWAEGKGKNLAKSKNITKSWGTLKKMLSEPHVTPERRREFDKMTKDDQDVLKSAAGWISGAQCKDNHRNLRNILPRDLLTIDIDYAPETVLEDITEGYIGCGIYEAFYHSSRRHTPEAPRVRIFMPMSRKVSVDEYIAIVRFMGLKIDATMKMVDQVSYRPAQMMFKPTCSKDDRPDFFTFEQHGIVLDPDRILAEYEAKIGDWRDLSLLPKHPDETLRKKADRAEDPRTKDGPVGVFCRTYSIEAAMEKFIPGTYIPGDQASGNPRYTYANSTSSNGAVVYDDGLFLYSNHGHDPLCDMNVNAWDMVRIHKFGAEDEKTDPDAPMGKRPSFKAMWDYVRKDDDFVKQQVSEKYSFATGFDDDDVEDWPDDDDETHSQDDLGQSPPHGKKAPPPFDWETDDEFADAETMAGDADDPVVEPGRSDDVDDAADERDGDVSRGASSSNGTLHGAGRRATKKRPEPSKPREPLEDWFPSELELSKDGDIVSTLHNVATLIQNDSQLFGRIWYNDFSNQIVARKNIKPRVSTVPPFFVKDKANGDRWQDFNDISIRALLEAPNGNGKTGYGLKVSDRDMNGGVNLAARLNTFHPIRDYLLKRKWDGKPRVDTFLSRYLGCPDTPYHREIAALMLIASVARVMEPGHKFDYALILQGPQGTRKSTFIKTIYSPDWFGELHCDLGDKQAVAEEIAGKWGIELPELGSLNKTGHNEAKAFMRRQHDDVRMSYDRRVSEFPRQCVCWGSTNDDVFLKDPTGNRSYWPVKVRVLEIDTDALLAERDQLWAEAVERYFVLREDHPNGDLPLTLLSKEAIREATGQQEAVRAEEIFETWAQQILDWLDTPVPLKQFFQEHNVSDAMKFGGPDMEAMVLRCAYVDQVVIQEVLKKQGGQINDAAGNVNMGKVKPLLEKAGWWFHKADKGGVKMTRVSGASFRWKFRKGATVKEQTLGYRVVEIEEEEENDVI